MERRIMSIYLPVLPLDRRRRLGDPRGDFEFAIIAEIKSAFRLTHVSPAAFEAGLRAGMSVSDARAICPRLMTQPGDPMREDMLLRALRRWADRLSPWVALDEPDGLMMDMSGCAHLFGGERAMAEHARHNLSKLMVSSKIGVADTKRAAQALARFNPVDIVISERGQLQRDLKDLPVEALRLNLKTSNSLRRVGLRNIGQLYDIKPAELSRRYGLDVTKALTKALGQAPDPISPMAADPVFSASKNMPEPIGLKADVERVLGELAASVCRRLKAAHFGARQFHFTVRCVDTGNHVLTIGFARPCHDPVLLKRQFDPKLDALKIKFGADWFRLLAGELEPIRERQGLLECDEQDAVDDLSQVIATLGNRLGFDRVRRFVPKDSHHPDCEFATIEAVEKNVVAQWPEQSRLRPLRVFRPERLSTLTPGRPPKRFEWRKTQYATKTALGPERLSPEWWKSGRAEIKDYWAVETEDGPRLWLLTYPGRPEPDWFVTGEFP